MNEYNNAFFNLFQNLFIHLKVKYGEKEALESFTEIMEKGLKEAYGANFTKGDTINFAKILSERDENVGLRVEFKNINEDSIIYEFHTDPFPKLKGIISHSILDSTYMNFKVKHLLGEDWGYETKKHMWKGDSVTQYYIRKVA